MAKSKAKDAPTKPKRKPPKETAAAVKMGRPVEITDEMIEAALRKYNGRVYIAAEKLCCCPETIMNRLKANPTLKAIKDECKGRIIDLAEDGLLKAVKDGDFRAIKYTLGTLGRHRGYVERKEIRHGGDSSAPPIQSQSQQLTISPDDLPIEVRKVILDIIRAKKSGVKTNLDNTVLPKLGLQEIPDERKVHDTPINTQDVQERNTGDME